jgi:hypothetical protein
MLDAAVLGTLKSNPSTLTGQSSGSGLYSEVFDGPIPGTVIKHGKDLEGDAWVIWAAYCMSYGQPDPFMPVIHALHIDCENLEFWAVMEKLEPTEGVYDERPRWSGTTNSTPRCIPSDIVSAFKFHWRELHKAMGHDRAFYLDAHAENWMWRGDQLVLTDPLVFDVIGADAGLIRHYASQAQGRITIKEECDE